MIEPRILRISPAVVLFLPHGFVVLPFLLQGLFCYWPAFRTVCHAVRYQFLAARTGFVSHTDSPLNETGTQYQCIPDAVCLLMYAIYVTRRFDKAQNRQKPTVSLKRTAKLWLQRAESNRLSQGYEPCEPPLLYSAESAAFSGIYERKKSKMSVSSILLYHGLAGLYMTSMSRG